MLTYNSKYRYDNLIKLLNKDDGDFIFSGVAHDYLDKVGIENYLMAAEDEVRGSHTNPYSLKGSSISFTSFYKEHHYSIVDWLEREAELNEYESVLRYVKHLADSNSDMVFKIDDISKVLNHNPKTTDTTLNNYNEIAKVITKLVIKNIGKAYRQANIDFEWQEMPSELEDYLYCIEHGRFYKADKSLVDQYLTEVGARNFVDNSIDCTNGFPETVVGGTELRINDSIGFFCENRASLLAWLKQYTTENGVGSVLEFVQGLMDETDFVINIDTVALVLDQNNAFCVNYKEVIERVIHFFGEELKDDFQDFMITNYVPI